MPHRAFVFLFTLVMFIAAGSSASAAPGIAAGNVNMRTCPGVRCAKILTIPRGAAISVRHCARWCEVVYRGRRGFVSVRYVAFPRRRVPSPVMRPPAIVAPPPVVLPRPGPRQPPPVPEQGQRPPQP